MTADSNLYGVLTRKEKEFLTHVDNGLDRKAIAEQMQIRPGTIRTYVKLCNQKMQTRNVLDAARIARQIGQI